MTKTSEKIIHLESKQIYAKLWTTDFRKLPIILMHDSLGCVELWRDFPQKLSEQTGRSVLAYDRIGYGKSTPRRDILPADFILEEALTTFPKVLEQYGINDFLILGHSIGGGMSTVIASKFKNCQGVVSISAQSLVEDKTKKGVEIAIKEFLKPDQFAKLEKYQGVRTQWMLDSWSKTWLNPQFTDWTLKEFLKNIKVPILILHGENDEFGSEKHPELIFNSVAGPKRKIILKNCAHFPHREHPDLVLRYISEFINEFKLP